MLDFDFFSPTRFVFGAGRESEVGDCVKSVGGSRVLIHFGGGSVVSSGLLARVVQSLNSAGIFSIQLGGVAPNPRDSLIREGIELCRREKIDLVLGIGGGSAIDSAKAIAIGTCYDGDFWDLYVRKATPLKRLLLGTILTLPATGTEGSNSSVVKNESLKIKRGLRSDLNRPDFSILNPELTYTLPAWQIACGASDILAHILERYFSGTEDDELTDRLCEATMISVIESAVEALKNPTSYSPRANLMWASTIAHNGTLGVGREEDWSVHALEAELGGWYDTAHGAGLAALYPAWLQFMLQHKPRRVTQLANRVFGVTDGTEGIRKLASFYLSLGLPVNLRELGVRLEDLTALSARVKRNPDGTCGHYLPLNDQEILEIYRLAFDLSFFSEE